MKKTFHEEWPLIVGVLAAVIILCQHVFNDMNIPAGSDWGVYLRAAEHVWHPERETTFPDWRTPTYAYLVGALGESMGYVRSGQLLSSLSAIAMVFAAALAGRALSNSWAGGLAALVCAALVPVAHGAHWVNHYPLLGATTGLSLATGILASRRPHLLLGLICGACAGASWALDLRGFAAVPAGGALCVIGGLAQQRAWLHRIGTPLLFLVAVGGLHTAESNLSKRTATRLMPLEQQVLLQRELSLDWQTWEQGPQVNELKAACADAQPKALELQDLKGNCAQTMFRINMQRLQASKRLPPSSTLLLLLIGLGIPAAWGSRSLLAQGVFFGVPVAAIGLGATWVMYWDRYVLQFAVPIAVLVPVALSSTGSWLGRRTNRGVLGEKLGTLASAGWLLLAWPLLGQGFAGAPTMRERVPGQIADWAAQHVGEEDQLVDCTGLGINQFLLPKTVPLLDFVNQPGLCTEYLRRPATESGKTWVIARHMPTNTAQRGVERSIQPEVLIELGWQKVDEYHDPPSQIVVWEQP
ncbi:MAG: hypothetical protein VX519_04165 [Myxococcota bacterium]|nr:hypothetical protein [Myxococcota bacterium]